MPWRLIVFIVLFLIFFLFIVFNLENKTDIRFGPVEKMVMRDIPVFVTVFFSFLAGMFCTFPFLFRRRKKIGDVQVKVKVKKGLLAKAAKKQGDTLTDKSHYGID
jgi:uncharacterized integral membrane protein